MGNFARKIDRREKLKKAEMALKDPMGIQQALGQLPKIVEHVNKLREAMHYQILERNATMYELEKQDAVRQRIREHMAADPWEKLTAGQLFHLEDQYRGEYDAIAGLIKLIETHYSEQES